MPPRTSHGKIQPPPYQCFPLAKVAPQPTQREASTQFLPTPQPNDAPGVGYARQAERYLALREATWPSSPTPPHLALTCETPTETSVHTRRLMFNQSRKISPYRMARMAINSLQESGLVPFTLVVKSTHSSWTQRSTQLTESNLLTRLPLDYGRDNKDIASKTLSIGTKAP